MFYTYNRLTWNHLINTIFFSTKHNDSRYYISNHATILHKQNIPGSNVARRICISYERLDVPFSHDGGFVHVYFLISFYLKLPTISPPYKSPCTLLTNILDPFQHRKAKHFHMYARENHTKNTMHDIYVYLNSITTCWFS